MLNAGGPAFLIFEKNNRNPPKLGVQKSLRDDIITVSAFIVARFVLLTSKWRTL